MRDRRHLLALLEQLDEGIEQATTELPTVALRLSALLGKVAARLHQLTSDQEADDCECYDAKEVSRRLGCSVDLVQERGEEWGIAKVLASDSRGRPTRVVYPKVLLRTYLARKPREEGRERA